MSNEILTTSVVSSLAAIVTAAQTGSKVARLADNGDVLVGTARSVGDERGHFLGNTDDVRDGFLRVTLLSGFEAFWPIRELVPQQQTGEFVTDYQE